MEKLPPGFRFHPTDVELVAYYLKEKVAGRRIEMNPIAVVDLYKMEPWELPALSALQSDDQEWYFYCARDRKYSNGSRTNRATGSGFWKSTGKDRCVRSALSTGMKKTLVYHRGRAPRGERTDWVMHEYRMEEEVYESLAGLREQYVLVRVFKKSGAGPKVGEQYGAAFVEAAVDASSDHPGHVDNQEVPFEPKQIEEEVSSEPKQIMAEPLEVSPLETDVIMQALAQFMAAEPNQETLDEILWKETVIDTDWMLGSGLPDERNYLEIHDLTQAP